MCWIQNIGERKNSNHEMEKILKHYTDDGIWLYRVACILLIILKCISGLKNPSS